VILALASPPPPPAEVRPALAGCDGSLVSRITIRTYRPSERTAAERAAAATSDAIGLDHRATQPFVIRAYLLLHEGEPCTERLRLDSERQLRAQPFVASASVTAVPDGPNSVQIRVSVVDELPWTASARASTSGLDALRLGSQNVAGRGLTAAVGAERGRGYRSGYSLGLGQAGALGRPAYADAEWQRRPLGGAWRVTYAEPYFANDQRNAFHGGYAQETLFATLVRAGTQDAVVRTRRAAYHAGWIKRLGAVRSDGRVALGGLMLMGTTVTSSATLALRGDDGLIPTDDSSLVGRHRPHANGRVGVLGGLRKLRFQTFTRLETLRAEQDVASGFELDALVAPSVNRSALARDLLVASDVYLGRSGPTSFVALKMRTEGRRTGRDEAWEGIVGSARLSWHRLVSPTRTRVFTATVSALQNLAFPAQLTFRDPEGGLVAFPEGSDAGGARAVLRLEERRLLPWLSRRAGLATGWFVDAGQIWAGDVPYGANSVLRGSVGISLIGSYPATSKRMYRVDLAVPINPTARDARLVLRMTAGDRTGVFWAEPLDVARARASATPIALVRW
jgi:hypothetical protein